MKHSTTLATRLEEALFSRPLTALLLILAVTLVFALQVPRLRVFTDFADLLPQNHPYIQTYERIKENFGGANLVVLAIEVEQGTIFNDETLDLIHKATQGIDTLPGINHNLVTSLTHRTVRKVFVTADGGFGSEPYYDAQHSGHSEEQLQALRRDVMADPRVHGLLVSPDLKAALIKGQLVDGDIDYSASFQALQAVREGLETPGHRVHATGNPVLIGWVYTYLDQILLILALTLASLAVLLLLYFRSLYGLALPLLGIAASSLWGLGFTAWLGFNLEPLTLPIPFLIAARATSHGVQLVSRYDEELALVGDSAQAARRALHALFGPGALAVVVDTVGIAILVLGSAPSNWKLGLSAGFWAFSVLFTVQLMIPLLLAILPAAGRRRLARPAESLAPKPPGRSTVYSGLARGVLATALVLSVAGAFWSVQVQFGEAEPGSPILHRDHDYNRSTAAINALFPGSEELHIVARTDEPGGIKRPDVLRGIEQFQAHMLQDPELGGVKSLPAVVRVVNRLIHSDDPRWMQIPDNSGEVGGLLFAYLASSPIPGGLNEFLTPGEDEANLVFYYKDHRAETVARALYLAQTGAAEVSRSVPGLHFEPGGGIIGITAASNEALHQDHLILVPSVIVLAFLLVMGYYRSLHAGWLMVLPMLFALVMTYAYMGLTGIGISVATVPVIMVGIGVGIDYAVYFIDRLREETRRGGDDLQAAALRTLRTTGIAVSFTAVTLIAGVILWVFLSDLRFQSDAAKLLSFMLVANALAAIVLVPAWCLVFRPGFLSAAGTGGPPRPSPRPQSPHDTLPTHPPQESSVPITASGG